MEIKLSKFFEGIDFFRIGNEIVEGDVMNEM